MHPETQASMPRFERSLAACRRLFRHIHTMMRYSLVSRLLYLLLFGSIVVYLTVNIGLWWTASDLIDENLEKQAVRWLAELDELGTPLYASRSGRHVSDIERRIKNFPEIAFIRYYDASGRKILGEFGTAESKAVPQLEAKQIEALNALPGSGRNYLVERSLLASAYLRFITPIRVRAIRSDGLLDFSLDNDKPEHVKVIGYLDLSIDSAYYKEQLVRSMASGSLIIAGLLLVGLLFGSWVIRRALAPLTALREPLARLAHGDTDVAVARAKDVEIGVISDALNATIKAIRERDEALRHMAESDPLTGLVNRTYFARVLAEEIARVAPESTESAVYFIDLDKFKEINDTYGHSGGDALLKRVAEFLKSTVRSQDVVCRMGGDEFTLLVRAITREEAVDLAAKILVGLNELRVVWNEHSFGVLCSIGIAMIDSSRASVDQILTRADLACFAAKSNGRNGYHVYQDRTEAQSELAKDNGWIKRLEEALREDKFVLHFQPIVPSGDSSREFFEVLLRLPGPSDQLVRPPIFLPLAQRLGLMADIDRWVIRRALESLAALRAAGRDVVFSINLSGHALQDEGLLSLIQEQVTRHRLPADCVIFEIAEQTAMRQLECVKRLAKGLHACGCRLALDDFGAGFSSFTYLKELGADLIKIDGSFVSGMTRNAVDGTMIHSIVHLARALDMETIAEFVPDRKTVDMLKECGVDYLQGHFVGAPAEAVPQARPTPSKAKKQAN